ncbi:MAG: DUF4159 domain-containing protein, partial [Enhydrobacter sp.]
IQQQVLAEPTPDLADKTWARLADGTPLVTGEKRGKGYLVLVHTTANTNWSNLALSGLFVDMLQRLVLLSRGVAGDGVNKALKPWRALDGFGRLGAPPAGVQMLQPDAQQTFVPKPTTPPGFYGDENAQVAFNIGDHVAPPAPIVLPSGVTTDRLSEGGETDLARWCLLAAALLLLVDLLLSLWLRGLLPRAVRFGRAAPAALLLFAAPALLLFAAVLLASPRAEAQQNAPAKVPSPMVITIPKDGATTAPKLSEQEALKGALDVRLAYIVTGDKDVDDTSKAGLEGLSEILRNRTSVEPADPVGLDLEKDEPRLYPMIYWPITSTQTTPSPKAAAALDRYLRTGGILLVDTRDQQMSFDKPANGNPDLKRLLAGIETPPLIAMPPEHVLTKSFYLLSDMPGRWQGGKLWIETGGGRVNDGVTTIIIGSNDYAGAWAVDARGRGLNPVTPGGETQREMSFRVGVNLVMHALTGNYKDDQVHIQDIMQRLRR